MFKKCKNLIDENVYLLHNYDLSHKISKIFRDREAV